MPFGSNTVTYKVRAKKDGSIVLGPHGEPSATRIDVPVVDPPEWWSAYLLEEWMRKFNVEQKRRDGRTGWQRDKDQWDQHERGEIWHTERPGSTGAPTHKVWE